MLGKLIKYEFKATSRSLIPLYVALLAMSIINKIFFYIDGGTGSFQFASNIFLNFFKVIVLFVFALLFFASKVITLIIIIQRFYKNLLKDEGYLMNTLPIKASNNIISKLITAVVWNIASIIVSLISILIIFYDTAMFKDCITAMGMFINECLARFGGTFYVIIFEIILMLIVMTMASVLMIYISMLIGNLFNKHKILCSFAAFVILHFVLNIFSIIPIYSFVGVFELGMSLSFTFKIHAAFIMIIGYLVILSIILFFGSNYILKNRLNLE